MTTATRPISIDRARRQAGPVLIEVGQNELMKTCMNGQALAWEIRKANGAAIQNLLHLPAGPERDEALRATYRVHDKAKEALKEWLTATKRYESRPRRA